MTTPLDFIHQVVNGNAADAATTFNTLVGERLADALQTKKQEVAKTIFQTVTEDKEYTCRLCSGDGKKCKGCNGNGKISRTTYLDQFYDKKTRKEIKKQEGI